MPCLPPTDLEGQQCCRPLSPGEAAAGCPRSAATTRAGLQTFAIQHAVRAGVRLLTPVYSMSRFGISRAVACTAAR